MRDASYEVRPRQGTRFDLVKNGGELESVWIEGVEDSPQRTLSTSTSKQNTKNHFRNNHPTSAISLLSLHKSLLKDVSEIGMKTEEAAPPVGDDDWIHLNQKKEFSRLLYPNPVCFLCTPSVDNKIDKNDDDNAGGYQDNVMTITWLTAIDNEGRFVMSLNKRRHTAKYMKSSGREFCLCVPVAGMEPLVVAVGSTTGNLGSKFGEEALPSTTTMSSSNTINGPEEDETKGVAITEKPREKCLSFMEKTGLLPDTETAQPSKGQQKRMKKEALRRKQIPGHVRVAFGGQQTRSAASEGGGFNLFCMERTVAHLRCRSYKVDEHHECDNGHYLIFAEIIDAYCKSDYWNQREKIFCPKPGCKPFLSFIGSGRFGHVVCESISD